jgi:hypothetical protein
MIRLRSRMLCADLFAMDLVDPATEHHRRQDVEDTLQIDSVLARERKNQARAQQEEVDALSYHIRAVGLRPVPDSAAGPCGDEKSR